MCRRYQLLGAAMAGVGLGLLLAGFFESGFFCGCVGIGLICGGLILWGRR